MNENLKDEEIISDLYVDIDYNNEEEAENHVKELASSLKRIDKSLNSSIYSSDKQSYNQENNLSYKVSYSDGINNSIHGSKIKTMEIREFYREKIKFLVLWLKYQKIHEVNFC